MNNFLLFLIAIFFFYTILFLLIYRYKAVLINKKLYKILLSIALISLISLSLLILYNFYKVFKIGMGV